MKPIILVVDDEETQRKMLRKILIREGYEVESAAGGQDALKKFEHPANWTCGVAAACELTAISG